MKITYTGRQVELKPAQQKKLEDAIRENRQTSGRQTR